MGCGRGAATVGVPYWQLELTDRDAVAALVAEVAPDWVVNAAAMTNVDRCEEDADAARRANVEIVEHLAAGCCDAGVGLVQISTDYVFDGAAGPYAEGDATNPLSNFGRLKLESERLLRGLERALVVRTLWLYGYVPGTGANFTTWSLETLAAGEPLRVFADQWGNPTYVPDLARAGAGASGFFRSRQRAGPTGSDRRGRTQGGATPALGPEDRYARSDFGPAPAGLFRGARAHGQRSRFPPRLSPIRPIASAL